LCELSSGLYGYDASLSFIAVYYALCSSSTRKLLHAVAAAAAATLVHVAVGVTMAKAGLPAGTLGFVFATMVVVCCIKSTEGVEQARAVLVVRAAAAVSDGSAAPDAAQEHELFLRNMELLQHSHQQQPLRAAVVGPNRSLVEMQQPSLSHLGVQQQQQQQQQQQGGREESQSFGDLMMQQV
jgi:hypothetical protein